MLMPYRLFRPSVSQISVPRPELPFHPTTTFTWHFPNTKYHAWRAWGRRDTTARKWGQTNSTGLHEQFTFLFIQAGWHRNVIQQTDSIEITLSQFKAQVQGGTGACPQHPPPPQPHGSAEQHRLTADTPRDRHCWLQRAQQKPLLLNTLTGEETTKIQSPSPFQSVNKSQRSYFWHKHLSSKQCQGFCVLKSVRCQLKTLNICPSVNDGTGHHQDWFILPGCSKKCSALISWMFSFFFSFCKVPVQPRKQDRSGGSLHTCVKMQSLNSS